jgi:hypothetical protein
LQSLQQVVERAAQGGNLIARSGHVNRGDPVMSRDICGLLAHPLDGAQGGAGDQPSGEAS